MQWILDPLKSMVKLSLIPAGPGFHPVAQSTQEKLADQIDFSKAQDHVFKDGHYSYAYKTLGMRTGTSADVHSQPTPVRACMCNHNPPTSVDSSMWN